MTIQTQEPGDSLRARKEQKECAWNQSARKVAITAEMELPPRPLAAEELELLRWMIEHGSEEAKSFAPQIDGIRAVRWCNCGCPSIRLEVTEDAPLGAAIRNTVVADVLGNTGRGELVGAILFQKSRRLSLLEIYSLDGIIQGETQEFDFPLKESLRPFESG